MLDEKKNLCSEEDKLSPIYKYEINSIKAGKDVNFIADQSRVITVNKYIIKVMNTFMI